MELAAPKASRLLAAASVVAAGLAATAAPAAAQVVQASGGLTRSWSRSADVGTFSNVELCTGNVLTSVGLFGRIDGSGHLPGLALCHNSVAVDIAPAPEAPLGPGWSIHPLASLELPPPKSDTTQAVLRIGDGSAVHFTNGVSEPGYFLTLAPSGASTWKVVTPRQEELRFDFPGGATRGRLVASVDEHGRTTTLSYSATGLIETVTEASGLVVSFVDSNSDGAIDRIADGASGSSRYFDLQYTSGRLSRLVSSAGFEFSFSYDSDGRLTGVTDVLDDDGNGTPNTWNYEFYDASDWREGRLKIARDPAPHTSTQTFDYSLVAGGSSTVATGRRGNTTDYDFDTYGRLVEVENQVGAVQHFEYDGRHLLTEYTDAVGSVWKLQHDANGFLLRSTDPAGAELVYQYDSLGRAVLMTDPAGNQTQFGYGDPALPRAITTIVGAPDGLGGPPVTVTRAYYPPGHAAAGELQEIVDPNGVRTQFHRGASSTIDAYEEGVGYPGRVLLQTSFDAAHSILASASFSPGQAADPAGHPALPDGHPAVLGALSRVDGEDSNGLGLPIGTTSVIQPNLHPIGGSPENGATSTSSFEFDFMGRIRRSRLSDGQPLADSGGGAVVREYEWEYLDQPDPAEPAVGMRVYSPDGVVTRFSFDAAERVVWMHDSLGMLVGYEYRPNGQVASLLRAAPGGAISHVTYTYAITGDVDTATLQVFDGASWNTVKSLQLDHDSRGLPTRLVETSATGTATTVFEHDGRTRLVRETRTGWSSYDVAYEYDALGNRLRKTRFDGQGALQEYTVYEYDIHQPTAYPDSRGNRLMKSVTYDSDDAEVETLWYYYDSRLGNVREVVRRGAGDSWLYGTQLLYASGNSNVNHWPWLAIERRWIADVDGSVLPGTLQWLSAVETRQDDYTERYLVARRDPDTLERLSGEEDVLWADYFGSPTGRLFGGEYTVGPASQITQRRYSAFAHADASPAAVLFALADLVGTTKALVDQTGAVVDEPVLTAFGEPVTPPGGASKFGGFNGQNGAESGLLPNGWVRMGARWYDPGSGRFLQRDPLGVDGGLGTYLFAGNSPVAFADPLGLQSQGGGPGDGNQEPPVDFVNVFPHDFMGPLPAGATWAKDPNAPPPPPPPVINCGYGCVGGCPGHNGPAPEPKKPQHSFWGGCAWAASHVLGHPYMPNACAGCYAQGHNRSRLGGTGFQYNPPIFLQTNSLGVKCFPGDTPVQTPAGWIRIADVSAGDLVITVVDGSLTVAPVEDRDDYAAPCELFEIRLDSGGLLVATSNHPLLTEQGWVEVGELVAGTRLARSRDGFARVVAVESLGVSNEPVHNLRIAGSDNFVVTTAKLIVSDQ